MRSDTELLLRREKTSNAFSNHKSWEKKESFKQQWQENLKGKDRKILEPDTALGQEWGGWDHLMFIIPLC